VRRTALATAFGVLAIAGGAIAASPSARSTILRWLGIEGATIERVPTLPRRAPATPAAPVVPGTRTSIAEAQRRVGFRLRIAPASELGAPVGVYVDDAIRGGAVSFVYPPRRGLPRAPTIAAGAVLTQFRGRVPAGAFVSKLTGPGTTVRRVTVDGGRGYVITGRPHEVLFRDADGEHQVEPRRLAGNTILWEDGRITLRLEARVSGRRLLALARSIR
jgi:hypothetical protein